ncbi:hypothetical protein D0T87_07960 [Bacteroides sp. 51]|nr:hypothetical protein [Bacteroides sp. 51]
MNAEIGDDQKANLVGVVREPPNVQEVQNTIFGRFANRPYSKSLTFLSSLFLMRSAACRHWQRHLAAI